MAKARKKYRPKPDETIGEALARGWQPPAVSLSSDELAKLRAQWDEQARDREVIDHAIAVRDGLVAPSWMKKLEQKKARSSPIARVRQMLKELFPPTGQPPDHLSVKEIHARVYSEFEQRNLKPASYDTVARALGRR